LTVSVQILFGQPQRQIAALLRDRLSRCVSASLVAGFVTVEGTETIAPPLRASPSKLANLVVGAGTWRAFEALDRLVTAGVAPGKLHVHLGHSRATRPGATYQFYKYHPMLHSKVYLMDMGDGTTAAFVGSHNLTGFALLGLNGEAGILLEGETASPEFVALRQHAAAAVAQAVPYDPMMKEAYSWWTTQFIEGLRAKTIDTPKDAEGKHTIVIIAAQATAPLPQNGDVIYFEIPEALGQRIQSLRAEVHIYLFPQLPSSPTSALNNLSSASASLWCTTEGLELGSGGQELLANWYIDNRRQPDLKRAPNPFRPASARGMQQVRVRVSGPVFGKFEYLFDSGRGEWMPLFDENSEIVVPEEANAMLKALDIVPREDLPWYRVRGLESAEPTGSVGYRLALQESSPASGSFILFSLRRRDLNKASAAESEPTKLGTETIGGHSPREGPPLAVRAAEPGEEAAAPELTMVEHVTKKGKRLRGVVRDSVALAPHGVLGWKCGALG
jgi:hypothetical protein